MQVLFICNTSRCRKSKLHRKDKSWNPPIRGIKLEVSASCQVVNAFSKTILFLRCWEQQECCSSIFLWSGQNFVSFTENHLSLLKSVTVNAIFLKTKLYFFWFLELSDQIVWTWALVRRAAVPHLHKVALHCILVLVQWALHARIMLWRSAG